MVRPKSTDSCCRVGLEGAGARYRPGRVLDRLRSLRPDPATSFAPRSSEPAATTWSRSRSRPADATLRAGRRVERAALARLATCQPCVIFWVAASSKGTRVGLCPLFLFVGTRFTPRAEQLAGVRAAAERVARGYGLEIFDVQLRREAIGTVLRVIIDRPDRGVPETFDDAVGIEECSARQPRPERPPRRRRRGTRSRRGAGADYTLEVSSPGLDRPLRHEADYRRFAGRLAKVVTTLPIGGQSAFSGRIAGRRDSALILEEGRKRHKVPVAQIKRGHLAVNSESEADRAGCADREDHDKQAWVAC